MKMFCENCGKEHNGEFGSGRFCSKECARSYSSKMKTGKTKNIKCIVCGEIFNVPLNTNEKRYICNTCKYKENDLNIRNDVNVRKRQIKKCPVCGSFYFTGDGCKNVFCKEHNYQMFKTLIKYFTFDKNKLGTKDVEKEYERIKNLLYDLYWNQNMSSYDLARMFNYKSNPTNITQKFFKYLDIPTKGIKYAVQEGYLEGRQKPKSDKKYKCGWHETWDGRKVYLRSSYEEDFANKLDKEKIKYDVESLRIKYFDTQLKRDRCAVPDFYLIEQNTIVEIKSEFTLDIQNMKDKKKAYIDNGYNFKLICEHKEIDI